MRLLMTCVAGLVLAGCMVGPDYKRPDAPASPVFKELAGWTPIHPADAIAKGAWWSVYNDPELDRLERMVAVSNQTVAEFAANYRDAVALVAEARAGLFPTIGVTGGGSLTGSGAGGGSGLTRGSNSTTGSGTISRTGSSGFSSGSNVQSQYTGSGTLSWELDVWGSIRRQIEGSAAGAQASAADLANALLSAQATLATDYFDLRAEDSLKTLLSDTVAAYQRSLTITENQYHAGTASSIDYVTALAQLQSTAALLASVAVQRQQYEHAIAVLTGQPPANLTIPEAPLTTDVPVVPAGLPSTMLERRPDVAGAERTMQQENAQIGVQIAAYYPEISLSALTEYAGYPLNTLFKASNRIWELAASGSETIFNGGLRTASVAAARATYDSAVASYRQTVLTAFQQVEDALSSLSNLQRQADLEAIAVKSARRAVVATLNAYKAGTVAYTSVITEQASLLSDQQTALSVQQNRMLASVSLIEALGGGWTANDLPSTDEIKAKFSPLAP